MKSSSNLNSSLMLICVSRNLSDLAPRGIIGMMLYKQKINRKTNFAS